MSAHSKKDIEITTFTAICKSRFMVINRNEEAERVGNARAQNITSREQSCVFPQ